MYLPLRLSLGFKTVFDSLICDEDFIKAFALVA